MTDSERSAVAYVNFRDLGGHATPTGVVRTGQVFRSDSLAHCTPADVEHLVDARGIRTVIDLRRDLEVERAPVEALRAAGVRVEHRSLIDPAVPALATPDLVDTTLTERYAAILESSGAQFVSVVRLIADDANHPLVFHCAAGKDRTGLVAALVLETLGVADEVIVADYAKTAAAMEIIAARLAAQMPEREALGPRIMSAEGATMEATLEWLRAAHGGAEAYLLAHGLTANEVSTMRTVLIDPARGIEAEEAAMAIESSLNFRRVSDTVTTSGTVATEDLRELRARGYGVVVNLNPDGGYGAVAEEAAIVAEQGVEYVYLPVDFSAPTRDDFDAFVLAMDAHEGAKVHVHCAANYRVSAFYSLYAMSKGWWSAEEADAHVREVWDPAEYPAWAAFLAAEQERLAT